MREEALVVVVGPLIPEALVEDAPRGLEERALRVLLSDVLPAGCVAPFGNTIVPKRLEDEPAAGRAGKESRQPSRTAATGACNENHLRLCPAQIDEIAGRVTTPDRPS